MGIGFRPVRGRFDDIREFNTASAATFQQYAPVTFDGARNLIEATSASTAIVGIALSGSTNSFPAGKVQVLIPGPDTVFECKVQTGVATSALSIGQAYNIEKATNNLRIDPDSQASALVEIVGLPKVSTDSIVEVQFLRNVIGVSSVSSIVVF